MQGVSPEDSMGRGRQQVTVYQLSLFHGDGRAAVCPDTSGRGGTEAAVHEESQEPTALSRKRALTSRLLEQVCDGQNLNQAYKRVKATGGALGWMGGAWRIFAPGWPSTRRS